jgi:quercetin dioxygenase-like cupin family protein
MIKRKSEQYVVPKNWGHEVWIKNFEKYCGKLLFIIKDKMSSWHYHAVKEETLYLQSGILAVFYSNGDNIDEANVVILAPGDSFHVPIGLRHRLKAQENCELFEFSTEHKDEDSIRLMPGS